jgi:tetratricopeptide (TPR) repeat protein
MGVVFLALDTELNRRVAMKIVRPEGTPASGKLATPSEIEVPAPGTPASESFEELRARFLREAMVTGHMEHPGIVPVYEIGETEAGVPYYTMRFIRGKRTLRSAMEAAKTPEARLALLEPLVKVCDTLAYAHAHGVLHRDLKPENVALGEFGEVVVLDWGLAKVSPRDEPKRRETLARLAVAAPGGGTIPGALGTPGYMAPEAARGDVEQVDARADVYSLGVVLFECLTGRVPFETKDLVRYLMALASESPPDPRTVDPRVPDGLASICAQALARDRDARVPSASDLAARLRGWERATALDREVDAALREAEGAIEVAGTLRGEALLRQADRATALAAKALDRRPDDARAQEVLRRANSLRERGIAERERSARRKAFARVGVAALVVATAAAVLVGALLDERRREAEEAATRARVAEGAAREEKDRADAERDAATAARAQAERERAKAQAAERQASQSLARVQDMHVFLLFELRDRLLPLGRLDVLQTVAEKTLDATAAMDLAQADDDSIRNRGVALDILGDVRAARGDAAGALAAFREALSLTESLAKRDPKNTVYRRDLTIDHARIADMLQRGGDLEGALREYEEALRIARALAADEPQNLAWRHDVAMNLNYLGAALTAAGKPQEALAHHDEALRLRHALAQEMPDDAAYRRELSVTFNAIGNAHRAAGDAAAALAAYRESLAIDERLVAAEPRNLRIQHDLSVAWRNVGYVLRATEDLPGALEAFRSSLAICRRLVAEEPSNAGWDVDLGATLGLVGSVAEALGRWDEALAAHRASLERARAAAEAAPGRDERAEVASVLDRVAETLRAKGDLPAGLAAHREALAIYLDLARDEGDVLARRNASVTHNDIGDTLAALGEREQAAGAHRASLAIIEPMSAGAPENVLWRTDVAITAYKLAKAIGTDPEGRAEARAAIGKAIAVVSKLKEEERLPPEHEGWLALFEEARKEIEGS